MKLRLHDVEDADRLVESVITSFCTRTGSTWKPQLREEAHQFLLIAAWKLSCTYDRARGPSFSTHAWRTLHLRCNDFLRIELGRTTRDGVTRELPTVFSFDGAAEGDDGSGISLGEFVAGRPCDPAADRGADLGRLLRDRSSATPWRQGVGGAGVSGSVATGARRSQS